MTDNNLFKEFQTLHKGEQTLKQRRIVEEAIRLFAEKGYSNTSTAEIAKAAEVSEASIFKNYGTKDKLLLSLIVPNLKEIFPSKIDKVVSQFSAEITFESFLRAFLKNRNEFISENKEIFQILVKELFYNEELKSDLLPYISEVVTPRLSSLIDSAKQRGELIDIPTERIRITFMTYIGGLFASHFVLLNKSSLSENEIEDALRMMMEGFRKNASAN
ncbi:MULTISPECIES: TetR/AcrR family transcriptional regulator [unclassified Paenibacillus]|uniref:TetR/AcrR family transcriptional regulator n=1 Tax=unclassified Paenibacillus TaxID=185978 RepID=UPI000414DDD3|nr:MULTISPECIES: TetR/AcrR family transcriptional regulator [unclassified Paenibacillus]